MKILAIETSCDETAIAILEAEGDETAATFRVLGNALLSQAETHKEYGGVFPALAKREHAKNLVPILEAALEEAELIREDAQVISDEVRRDVLKILEREPGLTEQFLEFVSECEPPEIDAIAVTSGPGLEPALWVGINFARALSLLWDKPVVAINHMEGHILSACAERKVVSSSKQEVENTEILEIQNVHLPILALLISGGHTELVEMNKWPCLPAGRSQYKLIGETQDDAVGEAFDKVARMLGLPYPGGPEVSRLAEKARLRLFEPEGFSEPERPAPYPLQPPITLPRPMLKDATCDFSFAGLKTAVLYLLKKIPDLTDDKKEQIAEEFENAVADVLWGKTSRALEETGARTLVIGGGVSANTHIRRVFEEMVQKEYPEVTLRIPHASLTTDNAVMIGIAGFYRAQRGEYAALGDIRANGNLSLA